MRTDSSLIANGSVADQVALVNAGCITLNPLPGGGVNFQNGNAYTVQASDNGNLLLFTSATAVTVTLPATLPAGFRCKLFQAGTGARDRRGRQAAPTSSRRSAC